ncbi:DUF1178 family protein [Candidatus Pelagibacter sp.]|nr:DUF1178 family protein [Candidatus Pelagibacter sp.]
MIKYKLVCKKCNISFDSWFASSSEYDKLEKKNFLNCYNCNSKKIEKSLMAPKIINSSLNNVLKKNNSKQKEINKKLKEYQKFIKKNFDYVGENFAYEARSIHYNNQKKKKGIFGTASDNEIKELKEEGIDAEVIPWIKDNNN